MPPLSQPALLALVRAGGAYAADQLIIGELCEVLGWAPAGAVEVAGDGQVNHLGLPALSARQALCCFHGRGCGPLRAVTVSPSVHAFHA